MTSSVSSSTIAWHTVGVKLQMVLRATLKSYCRVGYCHQLPSPAGSLPVSGLVAGLFGSRCPSYVF